MGESGCGRKMQRSYSHIPPFSHSPILPLAEEEILWLISHSE